MHSIILQRDGNTVTENDLIEFNFRSGQSKKQFERASLPGLKFDGERIKKKGSNRETRGVSRFGGNRRRVPKNETATTD